MTRILTPQLGRRHVVRGLAAVSAATLVPDVRSALAAQQQLVTTPSQTEGPFYPTENGIRDARQRESVLVNLQPGDGLEPSALMGMFDIVLAG